MPLRKPDLQWHEFKIRNKLEINATQKSAIGSHSSVQWAYRGHTMIHAAAIKGILCKNYDCTIV